MKKDKMVTRTIESTNVVLLTVNVEEHSVKNLSLTLCGTFRNNKELLNACKEHETETVKVVSVLSSETVETLYGMPESVFMQYAVQLPPRKVYEKEV